VTDATCMCMRVCFIIICSSYITIDVILNLLIIISTHRRCHVASETGFKQDSRNPDSDLLLNLHSDLLYVRMWILKSKYPLNRDCRRLNRACCVGGS